MKTSKLIRQPFSMLLIASGVILMLLSACQPVSLSTSLPPFQPSVTLLPALSTVTQAPTDTPAAPATQTLNVVTETPAGLADGIVMDYSAVAQKVIFEALDAQPANTDGPYLEIMVPFRRMTLLGYPFANDKVKPQIFIYLASDLASANAAAGKVSTDLQTLLQNKQAGDQLPFMPLIFSARQALDAQVQYLDFKSGKGVRFLTQFHNGMSPITNSELLYTFQGLTGDGKYYISAVMPITTPVLAVDSTTNWQPKVGKEYQDYISSTVALLNQQPGTSFTPELNKLDAIIQSIDVK